MSTRAALLASSAGRQDDDSSSTRGRGTSTRTASPPAVGRAPARRAKRGSACSLTAGSGTCVARHEPLRPWQPSAKWQMTYAPWQAAQVQSRLVLCWAHKRRAQLLGERRSYAWSCTELAQCSQPPSSLLAAAIGSRPLSRPLLAAAIAIEGFAATVSQLPAVAVLSSRREQEPPSSLLAAPVAVKLDVASCCQSSRREQSRRRRLHLQSQGWQAATVGRCCKYSAVDTCALDIICK